MNGGDKVEVRPQVRKNKLEQRAQPSVNIRKDGRVFEKQDKQTKIKTLSPMLCSDGNSMVFFKVKTSQV